MSRSLFKIKRRNAAVGGGGGSGFTVPGSGFGDSYFASLTPLAADRKVMRSFATTADEADIGLAEECCPYRTSPPTSWLVDGPDVGDFEKSPTYDGFIRFTPACRTAGIRKNRTLYLTPLRSGVGAGPTVTLTIGMTVSTSDEKFVSYGAVNQSGDGSYATPWKLMPGSDGYTSAFSSGLGAGKVVFMKGEIHRTTHWSDKASPSNGGLSHGGSAGNPFWVEMNGWGAGPGGRAIMDGSALLTGGFTPSQAQVSGNVNYASFLRYSGQAYIEDFQRPFFGSVQCQVAQWPAPADLNESENVDYAMPVGSERFGARNYPVQTTGGTRRMYTNGSTPDATGTILTVVDPDFALMFGAVSASAIGDIKCIARRSSSFFVGGTLKSYDYATSTMEFYYSDDLSISEGFGSFGMMNSPYFMVKAGQYILSSDHTTLDVWPPNANTASISRLYGAVIWGNAGFCTYSGGVFQRYANGVLSNPATPGVSKDAAVMFWYHGAGTWWDECDLINGWYLQNDCTSGNGVIHGSNQGNTRGIRYSNILLNYFAECNRASGMRLPFVFTGTTGSGGSAALIAAGARGKIAYNSMADNGIGQTWVLLNNSDGIHIHHNIVGKHVSIHGNGYSCYDVTTDTAQFNINTLIEYNTHLGARFFTNNVNTSSAKNITIRRNFVLNPTYPVGAAVQCNGDFAGARFTENLVMNQASGASSMAVYFRAGGVGLELDHNVISGLNSLLSGAWRGAVHDNLIPGGDTPPASTLGGTYTNNKKYTGSPDPIVPIWGGVFTADMKAYLGFAGPIGASYAVPA